MTKTQVAAAQFLINKRMPNAPEDHNHNVGGKLVVEIKPFGGASDEAHG